MYLHFKSLHSSTGNGRIACIRLTLPLIIDINSEQSFIKKFFLKKQFECAEIKIKEGIYWREYSP